MIRVGGILSVHDSMSDWHGVILHGGPSERQTTIDSEFGIFKANTDTTKGGLSFFELGVPIWFRVSWEGDY